MSFDKAYEEWKIYASKRHKKQSFDTIIYNYSVDFFIFLLDFIY